MTLQEFKAWLDGFTDAMGDAPTPEQWAKIKAKLGEVTAPANWGHLAGGAPMYPPGKRWFEPYSGGTLRSVGIGPNMGDAIAASGGAIGQWAEEN